MNICQNRRHRFGWQAQLVPECPCCFLGVTPGVGRPEVVKPWPVSGDLGDRWHQRQGLGGGCDRGVIVDIANPFAGDGVGDLVGRDIFLS